MRTPKTMEAACRHRFLAMHIDAKDSVVVGGVARWFWKAFEPSTVGCLRDQSPGGLRLHSVLTRGCTVLCPLWTFSQRTQAHPEFYCQSRKDYSRFASSFFCQRDYFPGYQRFAAWFTRGGGMPHELLMARLACAPPYV